MIKNIRNTKDLRSSHWPNMAILSSKYMIINMLNQIILIFPEKERRKEGRGKEKKRKRKRKRKAKKGRKRKRERAGEKRRSRKERSSL